MAQTLKLGSLYLDNNPATLGVEYQVSQIVSFGEAAPGKAISWVPVNGLLIADRCLLTKISWNDLDSQSLVFGKEIELYGFRFCARLLKVGSNEGVPNEWDAALDVVGENDDLWHWQEMFFWGQETHGVPPARVLRGYASARFFELGSGSFRDLDCGFRPSLELMYTDPSALRHGKEILVIGRDGAVMGNLVDATAYDLVIRPKPDGVVGKNTFAANMRDGTIAVVQQGIFSIATTPSLTK